MRRFLLQILGSILGLYLGARFVPDIDFQGPIKIFLLAGLTIGVANYFLKPLLNLIFLPLKILTFGIIGIIINIGIVWFVVKIIFHNYFVVGNYLSFLIFVMVIYLTGMALSGLGSPLQKIHR
ncbi:phage holin family protein [bacterium]|nr:phage holin family protein [bacterium]